MKKPMKKLVLAKETVHRLGGPELREIAGGGTWQPSCTGCPGEGSGWVICRLVPTMD